MLFVQFQNKNIKGIERNFKVGFFLFLSGNTRNVGFSLSTFFFFFWKKILLSSFCNFRTIFYWFFLDFFHLLSVNRYSRTVKYYFKKWIVNSVLYFVMSTFENKIFYLLEKLFKIIFHLKYVWKYFCFILNIIAGNNNTYSMYLFFLIFVF